MSSQLLALADALDSREPAMIARTVEAVIRTRGIASLAVAGGVDQPRLKAALRTLAPEDCSFLREIVTKLLAETALQAPDGAITGDAAQLPDGTTAARGLRDP